MFRISTSRNAVASDAGAPQPKKPYPADHVIDLMRPLYEPGCHDLPMGDGWQLQTTVLGMIAGRRLPPDLARWHRQRNKIVVPAYFSGFLLAY